MGFFSNLKNKARRQVAPVMPIAPVKGSIRTPDNFVAPPPMDLDRKPILGVPAERTIEGIPISQLPFNPRMPGKLFPFPKIPKKNPIKRGGLAGLFRRLQEQLRNQQFPQPMQELRAGEIMPDGPVLDTRSFPRIPGPPAAAQNMIPNLDLGMPVMPEERMAPPVMNQMQGQPRMMMAVGGPLMSRAAAIAAKNKRIKGMADDIFGTDQQIMNIGRGQPGGLTYGPQQLNRIRNTENAIMAGGGLGVAGMIDATNMFSEPASVDNISFMSPEAMGTDLANLRVGIDRVIDLARNKASEMGADINEYVDRTRSAYDQQMENQRMQELDAEQGMQPFSMLMGPDMPLFRPEPQQRQQRDSLDDILADLEKKN
jgi:hypothetical protein